MGYLPFRIALPMCTLGLMVLDLIFSVIVIIAAAVLAPNSDFYTGTVSRQQQVFMLGSEKGFSDGHDVV